MRFLPLVINKQNTANGINLSVYNRKSLRIKEGVFLTPHCYFLFKGGLLLRRGGGYYKLFTKSSNIMILRTSFLSNTRCSKSLLL